KRYSLQTGPPKKDPKSKGVNPAAIQALLKKQQTDSKKKEIEMRKQKEELLAKRVELKSDRKARAMASRTKDNFRGYNGVPVVETPKKRRTKQEMEQERNNDSHSDNFRNNVIDPEDDEDNYEYEQTDSEGEPEPPRNTFNNSSSKSSVKPSSAPKSAPFNFADLLKLAEKKQHEPVELKPKIVKKEERLRTADEIRELELERKAKKLDKCVKGERNLKDGMSHSSSSSSKATLEKNKLQKPRISGSTDKQLPRQEKNNKVNSSSKSSVNDRDKLNLSHKEKDRIKPGSSSSSSNKMSSRPSNSEVSTKQMGTKLSSSHKSSASNNLSAKKDNSLLHKGRSEASPGNRPSSSALSSQKNQPQKKELQRPGVNANVKSNVTPKPGLSSSSKLGHPQARPGGPPQMKSGVRPGASAGRPQTVGQSRPGNGPTPGRLSGSVGGGAGAPRCTVVSETISSKNVAGGKSGPPPRPGMGQQQRPGMGQQQRPGMGQQQRPGMGQQQRPGMGQQQRPGMGQQRPGMPQQRPMLPPITSAYKRKFEDEEDEYDSEMDDFIDDGDDDPEDISQHIKQIFGYDRNKFKDESDYALRFMESSWKDMQKEEAR
ncbi:hypothetical protein NL108_004175, partial [Boleophthalmus pectinirostris]